MNQLETTDLHEAPISASDKRIKTINALVVSCKQETKDTWTLYLYIDEKEKNYVAGQFVSINPRQFPELKDLIAYFEHIKGKKETVRAYSMASAPHEPYVTITIKPEYYEPSQNGFPPLLSPMLASNILKGRKIEILGFSGAYILPQALVPETDQVIHMVAGSGIVPNFSILKDQLIQEKNTHIHHTLIFVNKFQDDIIFGDEIDALERAYKNRFSVHHFITQKEEAPKYGAHYHFGRPSLEHVTRLVKDPKRTMVFACGPALTKWQKKWAEENKVPLKPRFMEWVQNVVHTLNIDKKRYKREVYG